MRFPMPLLSIHLIALLCLPAAGRLHAATPVELTTAQEHLAKAEAVWKQGGDQYVLRDLRKNTQYTIDMAGFNKAGIGPVQRVQATTFEDCKLVNL